MEITVQSKYFGIATVGKYYNKERDNIAIASARMGQCEAQLPYRCRGKQGTKRYPATAYVRYARPKVQSKYSG